MAVARSFVEEVLVPQRQDSPVRIGLELDGHEGFTFGRRVPRPGEDELLVLHEFEIGAGDLTALAVRRAKTDAIAAPGPCLDLRAELLRPRRSEPAGDLVRIGPSAEDLARGHPETALEPQDRLRGEIGDA